MFELHPTLSADCIALADFPLCRLLMLNDSQYPWFVLVPRRADIKEIYQLSREDQIQLNEESTILARALVEEFSGDKMNIAALGNVVPQLHIHHIVRYRSDPAWPSPVWGKHPAVPYRDATPTINRVIKQLKPLISFKPI